MTPYLALPAPAGRTIVVGDIHGCWDELATLLAEVEFGPADLLLCVGDMIDRGPDSWRVARFFREATNAHAALGNHERRLARHVLHQGLAAWSQRHTLSQLPAEEHTGWARWLLALPAVIATPEVVVTHARLDPQLPLDAQDPFHTCAVGGYRVLIDLGADGVPTWYRELKETRPVCMGHLRYDRVALVPHLLYALDTGCCHGDRLTAVVLPEQALVSVPATSNHTMAAKLAWQMEQYAELEAWPVARLLRLQDDLARTADDWPGGTVAARVAGLLDGVDLAGRVAAARPSLVARLGELPPPGPERGEYFRRVPAAYPDRLQAQLVRLSLAGRAAEWGAVARFLEETTVPQLTALLTALATPPAR
jgi:serine/threonine protein phosphatase 1